MACCAMCNVLVSTTRLPNDPLTKLPFGGSVIAPSTLHIAQQAISQLTFRSPFMRPTLYRPSKTDPAIAPQTGRRVHSLVAGSAPRPVLPACRSLPRESQCSGRSEERRVGKECSYQRLQYHIKILKEILSFRLQIVDFDICDMYING